MKTITVTFSDDVDPNIISDLEDEIFSAIEIYGDELKYNEETKTWEVNTECAYCYGDGIWREDYGEFLCDLHYDEEGFLDELLEDEDDDEYLMEY